MNAFFDLLKCGKRAIVAGQVKMCEADFPTFGDDCRGYEDKFDSAYCYRHSVNLCAQLLYWQHFGFRGALRSHEVVNKGVELALEYFAVVADSLPMATGGAAHGIEWYYPYAESLLMATLARRTRERSRLSDFLQPDLAPEILGAIFNIGPELGGVLLCIAASFQSSPMETANLEERIPRSRKRRPKLLFKALKALESGDRATFLSALADSTANFAKTTADDQIALMAVALEESILAAVAYERGWTDLQFDLPIAARLVTHQSLELN